MGNTQNQSTTPALDLAMDLNPTGFRKCRLKEGVLPHFVRKGEVRAGDEFVTEARHAKELLQTGAADVLGVADEPDKSQMETLTGAPPVPVPASSEPSTLDPKP